MQKSNLCGFVVCAALAAAQSPPTITSVVNAGSLDARFCSGLLVNITGNNFGSVANAVTVIAGGQAAGVLSVTNNVIVAQLPLVLGTGTTTLSVNVNGTGSAPYNLSVDSFAPAFIGTPPILDGKLKPLSAANPAVPGQALVAYLVGLGPTNPLVPVGTAPAGEAPTTTKPSVTVGGLPAIVNSSIAALNAVGMYQVMFTVPGGVAAGNQDVVLTIGGKSSQKVSIVVGASTGLPTVSAVTNAASASAGLSPGVLAIVQGQNFGSAPSVSVGGKQAYVSPGSTSTAIQIQVPVDVSPGETTLTVTSAGQTSAPVNLNIDAFAPAFFSGAAGFQDPNGTPISASNPASPGKMIVGRLVGLGPTTPSVLTGQFATSLASTVVRPTLTVGGKSADFSYCGLVPFLVGVYEINFTVPGDVGPGNQDVVLTIGGKATPVATLITSSQLPTFIGFRNAGNGQLRDATHGIAPNTFLSIYASNIGTKDSTSNLFPATDFQGTEVLFNGTPAPLYNVLPSVNLINVVTPPDLPESGVVTVNIKNSNGPTSNLSLTMAPLDTAIFRIPDPTNGSRQIAAATIANTLWTVLPAATAAAYKFAPCPAASVLTPCAGPAHPGDSIVIYFTGGGKALDQNGKPLPPATAAPADGSLVYKTVATPTLKIGGLDAPVPFSGIAPGTAAEYQINTVIPDGVQPGDDVPVVLTFGTSSDTVTISVAPKGGA